MAEQIILVTGGARSGKSKYAEQRALQLGGRRLYLATAESNDEEMAQRIAEHKKRRGNNWVTIEEPMELSSALLAQRGRTDCALVDCLTIWLSNLLLHRDADFVEDRVEQFLRTLPQLDFHVVLVTNEVGWGIVPDNPLARQFRDLTGWANQQIATAAADVTGRGTGIDDATLGRKIAAIENGLQINRPDPKDALDVLAKVGGLEIGAMTGVILGAAAFRVPLVLDGFISGAAALLAQRFCAHVKDIVFASHLSTERGHRFMLEELQLAPLLDLQMRLGEGTGACVLMGLIESAVKIMREMATFESAGVKEKIQ